MAGGGNRVPRFVLAEEVTFQEAPSLILGNHMPRRAFVLNPEESSHRAVSSTRVDGALRFGGDALSTATITYA